VTTFNLAPRTACRLALTIAALSYSCGVWAAETTKFTANGMVCAFCARGIERRLTALPATQALYVDLEQKIVAVESKPGQSLDVARVIAEITDAGYSISKTETVSQSVEQIRAETKKAKK
jgi:cation transport ATPase